MGRSNSVQDITYGFGPTAPDLESNREEGSDTGIRYAAVGIPQGLIVDRENREVAGAVRRGGELVSLDPVEYGMWTTLLTPLTLSASAEVASARNWSNPEQMVARLGQLNLLVPIDPAKAMNGAMSRLRPIPLGCGLGNLRGDSKRFEIQNATLSRPSPISLDVVSAMFWWEFDGASTLQEIVAAITSRVPSLSLHRAGVIVVRLVYILMVNRMLYLDAPRIETN
jgi:hypothetical protein